MAKYTAFCLLLLVCLTAPIHAQWQVAIFPHENDSGSEQNDWFGRAITEAVMHAYYKVPRVRVIDEDIMRATLGEQWPEIVGNAELANRAQIHIVLRGHFSFTQDTVIIHTEIVEADNGKIRRTITGGASIAHPLAAVEPLLFALADELNVPLEEVEKTALARPVVDNLSALRTAIDAIQTFRQTQRQTALDRDLLTQAENGLKRAAGQAPNSALPHVYLGRLYEIQKRTARAEEAYRAALKADFEHVEARYRLARILKLQGRPSEALTELEQALRQSPIDPAIQQEMSGIFFNQYSQTFGAVVAQLQERIKTHPDDPAAYYELGNAYDEMGSAYDASETYYLEALKRDSTLADAHFKLGLLYHLEGLYNKAARHLYSAAAHGTQFTRVHFRLGEVLYYLKRYREAAAQFAKALEAEPNYVIPRYNLGLCQLALGQSDEAFETFQTYAGLTIDDHRPHFQLGEIYRQRGEIDSAINAYQKAIEISPTYVDARYQLAYLYAKRDDKAEAVRQLRTVLRLRPDHPRAETIQRDLQSWQQ